MYPTHATLPVDRIELMLRLERWALVCAALESRQPFVTDDDDGGGYLVPMPTHMRLQTGELLTKEDLD